VTYECPDGTNVHSPTECRAVTDDNSVGICEPNYTLNTVSGACERIEQQPYTYTCDGYTNADSQQLNGASCDVEYLEDFMYQCPEGYETYSMSDDKLTCSGTVTTTPAIECDTENGYVLSTDNSQCEKIQVRPFLRTYSEYLN